MYDTARFFAVTGDHLEGTPRTIEPRQAELEALHRQVWPELYQAVEVQGSRPTHSNGISPPLSDWTILGLACCARNWEKFQDLFDFGNWRDCGYPSQSEADLGLCCILTFYTREAEQLDRLFRQSKLYRPKWDEQHGAQTYGERTIAKALASVQTTYQETKPTTEVREVYQVSTTDKTTDFHSETLSQSGQMLEPQIEPDQVEHVERVVTSLFPALWPAVDLGLSVCASLLLRDSTTPVALIYVGGPSSGKTTVVNMFADHPMTYLSDNFTPASFVSHAANVSKDELKKIDLLPRIQHKVLVTPELAPTFRGKEDELTRHFAILIRVLDGQGLQTDSGTHGQRGYRGDYLFAWLGCTTPFEDKVWKVMSQLGSRLFFLVVDNHEEVTLDTLLAGDELPPYKHRLEVCRGTVHRFLTTLFAAYNVREVPWGTDAQSVREWIARCALALAAMRSEQPTRAYAVLSNLARGHALVHGRLAVVEADLPLVARVAVSSMPSAYARVFEALVYAKELTTARVQEELGVKHHETALTIMRELDGLGMMQCEEPGRPKTAVLRFHPSWSWCNSPEFQAILSNCQNSGGVPDNKQPSPTPEGERGEPQEASHTPPQFLTITERCMQNLTFCAEGRPSKALLIRKKLSYRCNGQ